MAGDLQAQLRDRRKWFFETQLRGFNMSTFAGLRQDRADERQRTLLGLISEPPLGGRPAVYKDNQEPVWTVAEAIRRDAFAATLIGRNCNWLDYREPQDIIDAMAGLAEQFANDTYTSLLEPVSTPAPSLGSFRRKPADWEGKGSAIARAKVAESKPWLLPELYYPMDTPKDVDVRRVWLENLEKFVAHCEYELQRVAGYDSPDSRGRGVGAPPNINDPEAYAQWVRTAMLEELRAEKTAAAKALGVAESAVDRKVLETAELKAESLRRTSKTVRVQFLDVTWPDDWDPGSPPNYAYNIRDASYSPAPKFVDEHFSTKARYWSKVVNGALGEVYMNKPDSDMGLCLLIRTLYLFGTIPEHVADRDTVKKWRMRTSPPARGGGGDFNAFFANRGGDEYFKFHEGEPDEKRKERERLQNTENKLRILLQVNAELPHAASIAFSSVAGEVLRQGLHHYKFWLDEPLRAVGDERSSLYLQKARTDIGGPLNWGDDIAETEMEYWSENHYIMFASSEYLAGQLWECDEFQPGKEFLDGADTGIKSGRDRKTRGKARVLKWLNHRLMFGWTEFHSSGYLREHLWALLNLVDFAMDAEVRQKANVVTDLLLFDIARFNHRGSMGAAGGRSQFKSRACGWDNGPGDAVELLFGTRGMFSDEDSQIGASLATSTYEVPDVLLEIGTRDVPERIDPNAPPTEKPKPKPPIEDRSRVSITFDEAYKYGIWFPQESDEVTSRREGYQPKLDRHYSFLQKINDDITDSHTQYGTYEDSVVFWWTTSSFVNQQVVEKSLEYIERYGLERTGIWAKIPDLLTVYAPLAKGLGLGGFLYGGVEGAAKFVAGLGPISGLLELVNYGDAEDIAEELAPLLDGSSRTRANISTYTNGDVMLSSIQNFRPGQLNYQSNVNQVTLNRSVNVFTTAGFAGADLSPITAGLAGFFGGAVVGGAAGFVLGGPAGAAAGAGLGAAIGAPAAVIADEIAVEGENLLGSEPDGPGWWTGYWALPMIVQHHGASIIAYKFPDAQSNLAEAQSHAWFPKNGFDTTDEIRCAAYEDDNTVFEEPFDYSKNGHWVFGKIVHEAKGRERADWPEAYVGVFSNLRPDWLDINNDADVYAARVTDAIGGAKERIDTIDDDIDDLDEKISGTTDAAEKKKLEDKKAALKAEQKDKRDAWDAFAIQVPLFPDWVQQDYFADKDWNVEGDNIWIIQVGSKAEFGGFDQFKDRVRRAKVVIDDTGGLECTYHMPMPDGGSKALKLDYDDEDFTLDGAAVQVDLYPRFENPYIRGQNAFPGVNRVEWGQRAYVITYNGKSLLHDLHNFTMPVRTELGIPANGSQPDTVRALVMFANTGHEEMEAFTKGVATVKIGCATVADEEIIAVGPIEENTGHDAEWIFFTGPVQLSPDLTIELAHQAFADGDTDAEWDVGFSLKALMADHQLVDCELAESSVSFTEDLRRGRVLPFTIKTNMWHRWEAMPDSRLTGRAVMVKRQSWRAAYYDHCDVLVVAPDRPVRHHRHSACLNVPAQRAEIPGQPGQPEFTDVTPVQAFSRKPGQLAAFAISANRLFTASADDMTWSPWTQSTDLAGALPLPVPFAAPGNLFAAPSVLSGAGAELIAAGDDGNVYAHFDWRPGGPQYWRRLRVNGFQLRKDGDCAMAGDRLFVLDDHGGLWAAAIDREPTIPTDPFWKNVSAAGVALRNFTVVDGDAESDALPALLPGIDTGPTRLLAVSTDGRLWDVTVPREGQAQWHELLSPNNQAAPQHVRITCATTEPDRLDIFVTVRGIVYTRMWNASGWQGWKLVVDSGQGFRAADRNPIVVHRVKRQLELLVETDEGDLWRAWWS